MPSRDRKLTVADRKRAFEKSLREAVELGQIPSKTVGLPIRVYDAIYAVAKKYPDTDAEAVQLARKEFADYLTWRREMAALRK